MLFFNQNLQSSWILSFLLNSKLGFDQGTVELYVRSGCLLFEAFSALNPAALGLA